MKIAVIGAGKQGARHLAALRDIADAVVADIDPARARAVAARTGAAWTGSVDAVFGDPDIAALVIATPTPFHAPLARRAVAAGKHFLCEKPFGDDAVAARDLGEAAARRGLIGRVGYLYRFAPAIRAARDAIGEIGLIDSAHFAIAAPGNHAAWKHRRAEGGGVANELISHMADLALWLFGPMRDCRIAEKRQTLARRAIDGMTIAADADDYIVARFTADTGTAVTLEGDFAAPRFSQWLEIRGSRGLLRASIDPAFDPVLPRGAMVPRGADTDLYRLQAQDFVGAVARPGATPSDACGLVGAAMVCGLLDLVRAAPMTA